MSGDDKKNENLESRLKQRISNLKSEMAGYKKEINDMALEFQIYDEYLKQAQDGSKSVMYVMGHASFNKNVMKAGKQSYEKVEGVIVAESDGRSRMFMPYDCGIMKKDDLRKLDVLDAVLVVELPKDPSSEENQEYTHGIVCKINTAAGPVCERTVVLSVDTTGSAVVQSNTRKITVRNPKNLNIEPGCYVDVFGESIIANVYDINPLSEAYILKEPSGERWSNLGGLSDSIKDLVSHVIGNIISPADFKKVDRSRSILLYGPPGCGKTSLARVLCSEIHQAGIPSKFLQLSATKFLNMFVGETEANIRRWFEVGEKAAKKGSYVIGFIDEIDAIAAHRGLGVNSDIYDKMVNTLLSEMDGFDKRDPKFILLTATNLPQKLDPALMNRFNKKIQVPHKGYFERADIYEIAGVYINDKNLTIDSSTTSDALRKDFVNWVYADMKFDPSINNYFVKGMKPSEVVTGRFIMQACSNAELEVATMKLPMKMSRKNKVSKEKKILWDSLPEKVRLGLNRKKDDERPLSQVGVTLDDLIRCANELLPEQTKIMLNFKQREQENIGGKELFT